MRLFELFLSVHVEIPSWSGSYWQPNLPAQELLSLPQRWVVAFRHIARMLPSIRQAIEDDKPKKGDGST